MFWGEFPNFLMFQCVHQLNRKITTLFQWWVCVCGVCVWRVDSRGYLRGRQGVIAKESPTDGLVQLLPSQCCWSWPRVEFASFHWNWNLPAHEGTLTGLKEKTLEHGMILRTLSSCEMLRNRNHNLWDNVHLTLWIGQNWTHLLLEKSWSFSAKIYFRFYPEVTLL